jgi:hypothetical protein
MSMADDERGPVSVLRCLACREPIGTYYPDLPARVSVDNASTGVGLADLDEMAAFARAVGHVLREERQRLTWSLAEVGEPVGLSVSVLCRVELGVRPVDMRRLVGLCAVLGRSPADVIALAQAEAYPLGWPGSFSWGGPRT